MKAARFPACKDLSGLDFSNSEMNEARVRQLHRCECMDGAQNVVLIGGPGTGKTHVATAPGIQAIEHHRRKVRFFLTIELVNALEQEKAKGNAEPPRVYRRVICSTARRPYRVCSGLHRTPPLLRRVGCGRWGRAGGGCYTNRPI